jgi:hypothetical protein
MRRLATRLSAASDGKEAGPERGTDHTTLHRIVPREGWKDRRRAPRVAVELGAYRKKVIMEHSVAIAPVGSRSVVAGIPGSRGWVAQGRSTYSESRFLECRVHPAGKPAPQAGSGTRGSDSGAARNAAWWCRWEGRSFGRSARWVRATRSAAACARLSR